MDSPAPRCTTDRFYTFIQSPKSHALFAPEGFASCNVVTCSNQVRKQLKIHFRRKKQPEGELRMRDPSQWDGQTDRQTDVRQTPFKVQSFVFLDYRADQLTLSAAVLQFSRTLAERSVHFSKQFAQRQGLPGKARLLLTILRSALKSKCLC